MKLSKYFFLTSKNRGNQSQYTIFCHRLSRNSVWLVMHSNLLALTTEQWLCSLPSEYIQNPGKGAICHEIILEIKQYI